MSAKSKPFDFLVASHGIVSVPDSVPQIIIACIKESIKRIFSSGLFWAAEKKTAISMLLLRPFFYVFKGKKNVFF